MALERVAHFARLAASDGGVLAALQDDPESMRQPLELSEAQVHALISASAFTSDKPVHTTSRAEDPVGDTTNLMELGTLGTLLPPEGSGAFPAPGELPPAPVAPVAPIAVTPTYPVPPKGTPRVAPPSFPPMTHVPQSAAPTQPPTPTSPSTSPTTSPSQVISTPARAPYGSPAMGPRSYGSPVVSSPVYATTGGSRGPASGGPQQTVTASTGAQGTSGQVVQRYGTAQTTTIPASNTPSFTVPTAPGSCGCACEVGMIAIVAQLSATAQSAITAITAIAGMN